ncbi:MAG: methionine adenosyltransferase [Chloroflexi bacterium]|nr:methionine adenosyltransferase [Chloroflexota bacterium]MBV9597735.1 methionine adenosyltransferase [Chloroflexota bacterium]
MPTTFQTHARLLFSSESVTEGHPDKMCDQISDAVLDWALSKTPTARVACESGIKSDETRSWVAVFGEVTPSVPDDVVDEIVRRVITRIGYTSADTGFDLGNATIESVLSRQSGDIAQGVDQALEAKQGELDDDLDTGAGDQGMMFGFACDESPELMPLPIALAHRLTRRLAEVRKNGTLPWLRPDGKSQVTVEYAYGQPKRVDAVVISTQHSPDVDNEQIEREVKKHVIEAVIEGHLLDEETKYFINPTGRFVVGGPFGDSGLTGRKIIVDTYGGMARHGGGAFSGKDPTKVDRSAAYAARWVAKNVVAAGLAKRCEVNLAYAIGVARPVSVAVETYGTETVPVEQIERAITETFDLRPAGIIKSLDLRRPIFEQTAAYGHFGRTDLDVPWERTDKANALKAAASSSVAASR